MMSTSKVFSSLALAGALTLAPLFASAQVTPPPGGQRQRLELERRLQLGFQRSIQNQLQLDQGVLQSLQGITQSFQEQRSTLARAQASLRYRLRDPALRDMGEAEARALLQEMVDLQQQEVDLYKREQVELLNVLTPAQLVRFYRLRDNMGQQVQQLRQGRGQGGGVGGGVGLAPNPGGRGGGGSVFR
jgi:Spy/CpxP family protein refolding chaperone